MNLLKRLCAIFVGPIILGCFIALIHWNTAGLPLIRDEGEYAYSAWLFRHGGLPYSDAFLQKPPMIVYTYWLAELVDDGTGRAARWLLVLFHTVSALVLGEIARREIGINAVWPARLLLGPLLLFPNLDQCAANVEQFMLLPLLVLGLLYSANRRSTDANPWFWAGFVASVAMLYKYTSAPIACYILITWLIESFIAHQKVRQTFVMAIMALTGCLLGSLLILSPFLIHDGGGDLYDCTIHFNAHYAATHQFSPMALISNMTWIMGSWCILTLLGGLFLYSSCKTRRWFYIGLFVVTIATTAGSWYGHYYLPLVTLLAFGAAGGMTVIAIPIAENLRIQGHIVDWLVVVAAMIPTFLPNREALLMSPNSIERVRYAAFPFSESIIAAKHLAEVTSPEDQVLVAGSEPQILYYAGRRNTTRFVIAYPMTIPTAIAETYQRQAVREIEDNPPQAIVVARTPNSWLIAPSSPKIYLNHVEAILQANYILIGGFRKTRDGGNWTEHAASDNLQHYSLLLYIRRNPESAK